MPGQSVLAFDGIKSKALAYCLDAFSSREAVSTSLENAMEHCRRSENRFAAATRRNMQA
jgi:hypothetical protein